MTTDGGTPYLSRRAFLRGSSALLGAAVLAACGGTTQQPGAAPTTAPGGDSAPADAAAPTAAPAASSGTQQLELWTFVNTHARWFRAMADDYTANVNPNFSLNVTEIAGAEMFDKLRISLQAGGAGAPDLADIEQGAFGSFLRSEDTGLVDLTERLQAGNYNDKLVQTRQALYTYQGKTYGVEHALTPVVLYYRADLWEAAGVDPTSFATWDDYIAGAQQLVTDDVKALPFPPHDVLLRQRGGDYFNAAGEVTLDSDLSIETMEWILGLRDQHQIAVQDPSGGFDQAWWSAVSEGKYTSMVGADWYAGFIKDNASDTSGMWKAIALPAFEPGGVRASCWGGTGLTVVRFSQNQEEAWKFLEYSMLSTEGNVRRFQETNLFPPFIPAMSDERLLQPDEFFGGQQLGELFGEVGPNVPAQYQSPFRSALNSALQPLWQDIYDGNLTPADAFKQVADEIRGEM